MGHLQQTYGMSQRRACRVLGAHRRTMRHRRRARRDEAHVRERLRSLAREQPRWGYRRLHILLQRALGRIKHKRVQRRYRRYRREGLAIRRRQRERVARAPRGASAAAWQPGEAWAMDFLQDVLADGRRFRTLNVLDIVTRECLAIEVDTSLPGQRVVRLLDQLTLWHGAPQRITLDTGPEFTGRALDVWAYEHHGELDFIDPGKPMQNGYLESFNGKFRDECLEAHWFQGLADARRIIADWRESYNTERPHSAPGGRTPTQQTAYFQQAKSLAQCLGTLWGSGQDAFEKVIIADQVCFAAPGRTTFGLPDGGVTAHVQVSRPVQAIDMDELERRLGQGLELPPDEGTWQPLVTPWWLAGLREEDRWRSFMHFFIGLELLHKRLVRRYYSRVVASDRVRMHSQASGESADILACLYDGKGNIFGQKNLHQRGEFAILALALFPAEADDDFATFKRIKQVRDEVAHGEKTIAETTFPVQELRTLFGKYLGGAIDEHLRPSRPST